MRHSLDGECGVVSKCVTPLICVSSSHWDLRRFKTNILSMRSVIDSLLINTTGVFLTLPVRSGFFFIFYYCLLWIVARP